MPYSKQHKQETRERILEAAASTLREAGVHGVGIGELMARAGLTHGGFYAHFPNKDALVAQACLHGMAEAGEHLLPPVTGDVSSRDALRGFIRAYLSRSHRDNPTSGCVLPTLGADVARSPDAVRTAFTDGLKSYLDRLEPLLPSETGDDTTDLESDALALLSGMAGAMLLARAVNDPGLSDRILTAARHFYTEEFAAKGTHEHVRDHATADAAS